MRAPALLILLAACGAYEAGVEAYRQERFREARSVFAELEEAAGDGAPARLGFNRALAALRAGDLGDAEASAKRAADRGDEEVAALCVFLRGNVAYARCVLAERQAATAAAEPFALDVAIKYAQEARRLWQLAAMSRSDWPAARRNVERALRKLEELERKKAAEDERRKKQSEPQPVPVPQPNAPEAQPEESDLDAEVTPQLKELQPDQVLRLIELLERKEREKLALRRAQRATRTAEVERDW
jgi:hypothetical protein